MKVVSIIIKDLKIMLSDKKAMAVMLLMPMILTTILSLALKGSFAGSDMSFEAVNIAVVKLYDEKEDSAQLESALNSNVFLEGMGEEALRDLLDSSKEFNPETIFFDDFLNSEDVSELINYSVEDENTARSLLDSGEVSAVVVLPEKFTYDMKINFLTPFRNKVNIKILTHPDRSIEGEIVKSVIDVYSNIVSSMIIGKNVIIETSMSNNIGNESFSSMDELMESMNHMMESIDINIEDIVLEGRKAISSADYYAVAMLTMFILFAAGQGGRMLLEEKDDRTYQRMMVAGTSGLEILSGKLIAVFLIALFQTAVMITFTQIVLEVQWGDLIFVVLISLAAAFAVAGLGVFVGALTYRSENYKIANIFESAIIQVMALLGGSFFPLSVMPKFMQNLSFLSLNGIALKAYLKVITGYETTDVLNYILILAAMGAVFVILAVLVLKEKGVHGDVKHNKIKAVKA